MGWISDVPAFVRVVAELASGIADNRSYGHCRQSRSFADHRRAGSTIRAARATIRIWRRPIFPQSTPTLRRLGGNVCRVEAFVRRESLA